MSNLKLYWFPASQPSRAVKALLIAGGIEHEEQVLDIFKGEHKTPEMLALNPAGQIPFITLDGVTYNESASILRFLSRQYPSLHKYYPQENLTYLHSIDAELDFNATAFRPALILPVKIHIERMMQKAEDFNERQKELLQYSEGEITKVMIALNQKIEKNGKYVCGNDPTLADFQIFAEMLDLFYVGKDFKNYPKVVEWHDTCMETSGIKEVHEKWYSDVLPQVKASLKTL